MSNDPKTVVFSRLDHACNAWRLKAKCVMIGLVLLIMTFGDTSYSWLVGIVGKCRNSCMIMTQASRSFICWKYHVVCVGNGIKQFCTFMLIIYDFAHITVLQIFPNGGLKTMNVCHRIFFDFITWDGRLCWGHRARLLLSGELWYLLI